MLYLLVVIFDTSLHPDVALESTSDLRFAKQVFLVDTDAEIDVIAANVHHIHIFLRHMILQQRNVHDFSKDGILVALNSIRHKIGIHNA